MVTIYIDNIAHTVKNNNNLLHTCLSLGYDIPYFCWHPILGSVGACRQCAIKQYSCYQKKTGKIIMSCMTPVEDGICISINDEEAKQFRAKIIELLMINHPHDCPICEEGGNCHLQDMTVMSGHINRKYRFTKRTHYNQYLGPFIKHEMNRCITCYRCTRYYNDYADGTDFGVFGTHNNIYFGRINDGKLNNEFSGNLIEICPTGVFTDKTSSENYTRKWDLQYAPSICMQCSLGCNIIAGERHGKIQRIENRYNGMINHYFLCDRGRFGYGYVNRIDRPYQPQILINNKLHKISAVDAITYAANIIKYSNKIIGIGSPRASIESNYTLQKLVGKNNFFSGLSNIEHQQNNCIINILEKSGIYTPSMREIESYDAIYIAGENITKTGPRIALAIRQAIKYKKTVFAQSHDIYDWHNTAILNIGQNIKYPLIITSIDNTNLDDIALLSYKGSIIDQAKLAFTIANIIDHKAPSITNTTNNIKKKAEFIAQILLKSKHPLIISGSSNGNVNIIQSAANIALALKKQKIDVGITYIPGEANSIGLGLMNAPSLDDAIQTTIDQKVDTAIIMENDLYRHGDMDVIDNALKKIKNLIVIDHCNTSIINKANLILSSAAFTEGTGTVINNEGRAQRYFQVYNPSYYNPDIIIKNSWSWLFCLHSKITTDKINWSYFDHILQECSKEMSQFSDIIKTAPNASYRINGQKVPRTPNCYSGRTALLSNIQIHEPGQPKDNDSYFAFSMEGNNNYNANTQQIPFVWAPGWNSPQAWNKFQNEIGKNLHFGDPGIRLFKSTVMQLKYFNNIPPSINLNHKNQRIIVAYYHLFGNDETSQKSMIIQKHMITPYIMINTHDAKKLNLQKGDIVEFTYKSKTYKLPISISDNLSLNYIGLPLGIPDMSPNMIGNHITNLHKVKI
uniref:NADH-quinone oxidoreductase n=1 Tax=Candidatus Aschnera chinzeii TaxID=1485666 RepID=A0AAT9G4E2_9ENTR|nr:MAG: NADH-quinone oxidoreductase subunit NuoG [Candidatus Aschnera chinzeii]